MRVKDVMVGTPASCRWDANAAIAVEILWNRNCGILPVVNSSDKVIGVVTDRDLCIAMGTRNQLPGDIMLSEIASEPVFSCQPDDDIHTALATMAQQKVRRLPVINVAGELQGILSMDDVVYHADAGNSRQRPELSYDDVVKTLKHLYGPQLLAVTHTKFKAA
ncbi:MAG: CBS domain-containing protein [Acidipila sp.]|nr:CBS domain-containing protein [Acidipila sp.]